MTDDRAMKCAEEIVTTQNPQPYIHTLHIAGNQATTEAWMGATDKRDIDELLEKYRAGVAAIIRKHYPSSLTRIEKDKPETLPPQNDTVTVFVECGDKRHTMRNVLWNGYQWETATKMGAGISLNTE